MYEYPPTHRGRAWGAPHIVLYFQTPKEKQNINKQTSPNIPTSQLLQTSRHPNIKIPPNIQTSASQPASQPASPAQPSLGPFSLPEPSRHEKPRILGCLVCLSGPTRGLNSVRGGTSWGLKSSKCDVFIDVLSFQTRKIRHFEPPGAFQTRKIRLILPPRAFHSQNQANVKYLSTF